MGRHSAPQTQLEANAPAPLLRRVLPAGEKAKAGQHSKVPEEDPTEVLTRASQWQR